MFTAIVLSANPVRLQLPGVVVLPSIQPIRSPDELHAVRLDVLSRVQTPYCFYLDDDDTLPADYFDVLAECVSKMQAQSVPIAYTDELYFNGDAEPVRRTWQEYDSDLHAMQPMALHHLVLMDTAHAQSVAKELPRGRYSVEQMLYWVMAREKGAVYVPRVGYHWRRRTQSLSRTPEMLHAQAMSQRWVNLQRRGA